MKEPYEAIEEFIEALDDAYQHVSREDLALAIWDEWPSEDSNLAVVNLMEALTKRINRKVESVQQRDDS